MYPLQSHSRVFYQIYMAACHRLPGCIYFLMLLAQNGGGPSSFQSQGPISHRDPFADSPASNNPALGIHFDLGPSGTEQLPLGTFVFPILVSWHIWLVVIHYNSRVERRWTLERVRFHYWFKHGFVMRIFIKLCFLFATSLFLNFCLCSRLILFFGITGL